MSDPPLLIEHDDDGVVVVTLNRPRKLNAITRDMDAELARVVGACDDDPSARAIVLRGAGGNLSAGADMAEHRRTLDDRAPDPRRGALAARALASTELPVIALIDGYCLGGAAELTTLADFRVVTPAARIRFPEVEIGMIPAWGATQMLPRIVGRGHALDLLLMGRELDGADALRIGFAHDLVEPASLDARGREMAQRLADLPVKAARLLKRAVNASAHLPVAHGMDYERDLTALLRGERQA